MKKGKKRFEHSVYEVRHVDGVEKLDPTPVEIPVGFKKPLSLIRHGTFAAVEAYAQQAHETEEESRDFDIPDEFDPQFERGSQQELYDGQFQEEFSVKQAENERVRQGVKELIKKRSHKPPDEVPVRQGKRPKAAPKHEIEDSEEE